MRIQGARCFYRGCWWIAYGLSRLLFRLRVEGAEHLPTQGGLIVASNHRSYIDPVLIGVAAVRELSYVTKREVVKVPLLGWLIRKLNAIPIDRSRGDRAALRAAEDRLKSGGALFLFPEGTRNKGDRFLDPKPGIGIIVSRVGVPVVPAHIYGTTNVWTSLVGLSAVIVRFGRPIRNRVDERQMSRKETYHAISREVMCRIKALGPLCG